MAKTTTVQKIRDKFASLSGLDKDNLITDDASVFLELLNLAIDEAWLQAEWPWCIRTTGYNPDAYNFIDLSADTGISEVLRAYDADPHTTTSSIQRFNNIKTVENADFDGLYVTDATPSTAVSVSTLTSSGTTATCTTSAVHGLETGATVIMAGADVTAYNGNFVVTVTSTTVFTYTLASDPADTTTGTITSTKATVFLEHRIVTPTYALVTDTAPRRFETYLAYKTSADFLRGEGQEDKANKRTILADRAILNEIERLERQQNQQPPTILGVRIAEYR